MGVTANVYLIKQSDKIGELDFEMVLTRLGVQTQIDKSGISYEKVCSEFWERNAESLLGLAYYKEHFIVKDDLCLIDSSHFEAFTHDFHTSILQVENSDIVQVSNFSYYDNGQMIRRKSIGNDHWIEEMQESGLEVPEGAGDWDEGEALEIEKNGSNAFEVMKTYGIDYFELYELEWELRLIMEQAK